jgi:Flp pilus assembly protein TadD
VALQELGQFGEAKERFRQALAIDRNYAEARSDSNGWNFASLDGRSGKRDPEAPCLIAASS